MTDAVVSENGIDGAQVLVSYYSNKKNLKNNKKGTHIERTATVRIQLTQHKVKDKFKALSNLKILLNSSDDIL